MYVVVVGGGKVGYYLTKLLLEEGREVLLIEKDPRKCAALADTLGANVLEGDGCEIAVMEEAGMGRANVVLAVTGDDEDNLVICQVARVRFNAPRTIARVNNPKNQAIFRKLGIDVTISSTELIMRQIEQALPAESLLHLLKLQNAGVSLVELEVPASSPAIAQPLRSLGISADSILCLVIRQGAEAIIPSGDTVLATGDQVIAVTSEASEQGLRRILCG
jgi:trk system potassium uptake protein